jgi:hypothetical protein
MALIGGVPALARALAVCLWDPPDASYVAANSVLVTNNQQSLAYALRCLLVEGPERTMEELRSMRGARPDLGTEAIIRGLATADRASILAGIDSALDAHAREAQKKVNHRVTDYFLCIPVLGLSALALSRGLLALPELPADDRYAPWTLIALEAYGLAAEGT